MAHGCATRNQLNKAPFYLQNSIELLIFLLKCPSFQDYNHDYYRNLTLAYYVIPSESENTSESANMTTAAPSPSSSSTGVLLTTLSDNNSSAKTNETQLLNESELMEHNPLLIHTHDSE